jgi:hypothetical protein
MLALAYTHATASHIPTKFTEAAPAEGNRECLE